MNSLSLEMLESMVAGLDEAEYVMASCFLALRLSRCNSFYEQNADTSLA